MKEKLKIDKIFSISTLNKNCKNPLESKSIDTNEYKP